MRFRRLWEVIGNGHHFKRCLVLQSVLTTTAILPFQPALASPHQAPPAYGLDQTATGRTPKLTLRVYNYAGIDSALLARAEKVTDSILGDIGIETAWIDCPTSQRNAAAYSACDSHMGTADFVLRILPRRMASKARHSNDTLGFAQTCPVNEPACELSVIYHRVDELAATGYLAHRILGYVIAHEVAHILLGPDHSDEGILRAAWTPSDLQHISWGLQLNFTGDQPNQLRRAVLRRISPPLDKTDRASITQANLIAR